MCVLRVWREEEGGDIWNFGLQIQSGCFVDNSVGGWVGGSVCTGRAGWRVRRELIGRGEGKRREICMEMAER